MTKKLVKCLYAKLKTNNEAYMFVKNLADNYELYLFGGGVRDFFDNELNSFRDLDFVLKSNSPENINIEEYIPRNIYFKKNRFNGYKLYFKNFTIDVWNIDNTWAFEQNKLNNSVENLLNSVYLNIDSLLYSLKDDIYINNCDKKYKEIKFLDIILDETPFEKLNLLRALVYKRKYSLMLSDKLKQKFQEYTYNNNYNHIINELMSIQKEHYKTSEITKKEILEELQSIK